MVTPAAACVPDQTAVAAIRLIDPRRHKRRLAAEGAAGRIPATSAMRNGRSQVSCWPPHTNLHRRASAAFWTPSITGGPPAVPGGCCRMILAPGSRCIAISAIGSRPVCFPGFAKHCFAGRADPPGLLRTDAPSPARGAAAIPRACRTNRCGMHPVRPPPPSRTLVRAAQRDRGSGRRHPLPNSRVSARMSLSCGRRGPSTPPAAG